MNENKLYVCPRCGNSASEENWDENTKEVGFYDSIMSVSASKEDMELQEPDFYCPNCNEEVPGLEIVMKEA